ncbi:hypothetical protein LOAG_03406, partial [Loa loa]
AVRPSIVGKKDQATAATPLIAVAVPLWEDNKASYPPSLVCKSRISTKGGRAGGREMALGGCLALMLHFAALFYSTGKCVVVGRRPLSRTLAKKRRIGKKEEGKKTFGNKKNV